MEIAHIQTINLLYIYLCIWELDLRLNNNNIIINYYQLLFLIIIDICAQSFLSLELPSCMVTPVREIRNKLTSSSTNMNLTQNFVLPTVYQDNDTGIDILKG